MGRAAAVCYILTTTVVLSMDWSGWSSVPTIVACGCAVVVNASVLCSSTTYWSPPSCACWMLHIGTGSDPSVLQECSLPYRQALAHFPHSRSPMTRDVHNTTPAGCWGRSGGWHPVLPCHCATGSTCRSRPLHQPRNASLSSQGLAPSLFVRHRPRRGDTRSPLPTTARHAHAPPPFSPPPNPLGAIGGKNFP